VFKEVYYFPGGGGGNEGYCSKDYPKPTIEYVRSGVIEPAGKMLVSACGWQKGEKVKISIFDPSDKLIHEEQVQAFDGMNDNAVFISYAPNFDARIGSYTLLFKGKSGKTKTTISVEAPIGPRLYRGKGQLVLRNFSPKEQIRLLAYDYRKNDFWDFVAWQPFEVDASGELTILIDEEFTFVVIGENSGQIDVFPGRWVDLLLPTALRMPSVKYGETTKVFDCVEENCNVIAELEPETIVEVIGEPRYWPPFPPELWWHIRLENGIEGWIKDWYIFERIR